MVLRPKSCSWFQPVPDGCRAVPACLPLCVPAAYRLLPMGSHPRVADKRGTYDLFGPVNKLWGGGYDKAMSIFLACLKEFGDFARARWEVVVCCFVPWCGCWSC